MTSCFDLFPGHINDTASLSIVDMLSPCISDNSIYTTSILNTFFNGITNLLLLILLFFTIRVPMNTAETGKYLLQFLQTL